MSNPPVSGARPASQPAPRRHHPAVLLLAALLLAACLGSAGSPAVAGPVNLNAADAATLASELKGVGKVKAQAILDFRQKHGPFRSVDELAQVKGFSQKLIDRNRADIKLGPVAGTGSGAAPGVARPGVAQPGVAQPGVAQPGAAQAVHAAPPKSKR